MINLIGCLIAFVLSLIISKIDSIGIREAKILTIFGWLITYILLKEVYNA